MATIEYTALNSKGGEVKGTIEADSIEKAVLEMKKMSLFPTHVDLAGKKTVCIDTYTNKKSIRIVPSKPLCVIVSSREKAVLIRQLAVMCDAGLPLLRAIHVALRGEKNKSLRWALHGIGEAIESGATFAEALAAYPQIFDSIDINMVKAGEAAGSLHVVLKRLAEHMEKEKGIKSSFIFSALCGSSLVAIITTVLAMVLSHSSPHFVMLLPKVLRTSTMVAGIMLVAIFFVRCAFAGWFDRVKFYTPIIGKLMYNKAMASFCGTFGLLMTGGVPILQALNILKDICSNEAFNKLATDIHDCVKEGDTIVDALNKSKLMSSIDISLIQVGEETGALPEVLNTIADEYDGCFKEDIQNLNMMGCIVVALSMAIIAFMLLGKI